MSTVDTLEKIHGRKPLTAEERSRPLDVNGVTVSLGSFLLLNEGLSPAEVRQLRTMEPGELRTFGGGAFTAFTVERLD